MKQNHDDFPTKKYSKDIEYLPEYKLKPYLKKWQKDDIFVNKTGHSCVVDEDKIYLFGNDTNRNEILIFDTFLNTVSNPNPQQKPKGRIATSMVLYEGWIYLFGGFSHLDVLNDCWRYNIKYNFFEEVNQKGDIPPKRSNHAMIVIDHQIILYGGLDISDPLNDTCIFDIQSNTWKSLNLKVFPPPRRSHSYFKYNNMFYIFGGGCENFAFNDLWQFHDEVWKEILTDNTPSPRLFSIGISYKNALYIYGGRYKKNKNNELWRLDLETLKWELLCNGLNPITGHQGGLIKNQFYIVGDDGIISFNLLNFQKIKNITSFQDVLINTIK